MPTFLKFDTPLRNFHRRTHVIGIDRPISQSISQMFDLLHKINLPRVEVYRQAFLQHFAQCLLSTSASQCPEEIRGLPGIFMGVSSNDYSP